MSLNTSGNISLGGDVVGESINLELGRPPFQTIEINDANVRQLAQIESGSISLGDFQGKERYLNYGQQEYTTPGTYQWLCPSNVSAISVVVVGGGGGGDAGSDLLGVGGGGGGGALAYRNNVSVISGVYYTIVVGNRGNAQITIDGATVQVSTSGQASNAFSCVAGGGAQGSRGNVQISIGSFNAQGGSISGIYDGGGAGGFGGTIDTSEIGFRPPGGGGAGGYSGTGGYGARGQREAGSPATSESYSGDSAANDSGGGGGGGAGYSSDVIRISTGSRGGGVGLYGKGSTGAGGVGGSISVNSTQGGDGSADYGNNANFGAGGGGGTGTNNRSGEYGQPGAVRIIWPGQIRRFPFSGTLDA
jgi:hypothetical protein